MISTFHPCLLFCDPSSWKNEEYKDSFISNLTDHIEFIIKSNIKVAWSNDFLCLFWTNSPWMGDSHYEPKLIQYIYPKMEKLWKNIDQFSEDECKTNLKIKGNYSNSIEKTWLVLVHNLLHYSEKTFVVVGPDIESHFDRVSFFCNCPSSSYNKEFPVINEPPEWFLKIDYMDICPKTLNEWDTCFKLSLEMCWNKDFCSKNLKTSLESIDFSKTFKTDFLNLKEKKTKKRIIKSITKLLTLNHQEAGLDGGLQEEFIDGEYRIRISQGSRVHYSEIEDRKIFLSYIPASKHDSAL